jgi:hypothetical protein
MTTSSTPRAHAAGEQGIAIVLALFLITAMSVIGASLMLLSQTETYSSMNYRMMSQARYGAESGIQVAVNYLLNTYVPPGQNVADPLASYDMTVSPVTYNGKSVVLSADPTVANYPVAAVQTAYLAATQGSLPAGSVAVSYAPAATLIGMQQINVYGGGLQTIQTWSITSSGTLTTSRTAVVQVTATLETQKTAATTYGAFGTNGGCGALQFAGSSNTDSYDSSALVAGAPVISDTSGNVGTNGNLGESGNAHIYGTLSSPRVGVGACSAGNVDALSSSGHASVCPNYPACDQSGVVQLPQAVVLPTPPVPSGVPTTAYNGSGQTLLNGASVGNVTINTGTLTLCAPGLTCTINVNSISLAGNATIAIATGATVILNVVGSGQATPVDLTGGSTTNASYDPSHFQIQYAGTGTVKLGGNSTLTAMVYMPNAAVTLAGNNDFYGSLVTSTLNVTGNASIHYDRHLGSTFFSVGNPMMSAFSWKKY